MNNQRRKKIGIYFITTVIVFLVLLSSITQSIFASAVETNEEKKSICNATLDDNFEDNKILVVLKQKNFTELRDYTPEDFSEVNCINVTNLTQNTTSTIASKIKAKSNNKNKIKQEISEEILIDTDKFHVILSLTLANNSKENVLNCIKLLEQRDDILSAEPNYFNFIQNIDDDLSFENKSSFWNISSEYGINLSNALNIFESTTKVKVAVLDTGIDGRHEALKNVLSEHGHKDYILDNLDHSRNDIYDINSHGTHVAGIIAATKQNNGFRGVCNNVEIFSYRVIGEKYAKLEYVVEAIDNVAQKGIPIINYSAGSLDDNSRTIKYMIENYAGLFICAAGNEGQDIDNPSSNTILPCKYPSVYESENILSVGALKSDGSKAEFGDWSDYEKASNYGKDSVDIFAPGTKIYSTIPNNEYTEKSGTSMATPHVTGVAALIKSIVPDITTSELKSVILDNCVKDFRLKDYCTSGGRLDAWRAVSSLIYDIDSMGKIINLKISPMGEIYIPTKIKGEFVKEIGKNIFANSQITNIVWGDNSQIEIIGETAFKNCIFLNNIELPLSLLKIEKSAFENTKISQICILQNVSEIGDYAFYNCKSLKTVKFSSNSQLNHIGDFAFANCGTLDVFNFQNSTLKRIGQAAFSGTNLENFNFQNTLLTDIGMSAFSGTNLKTVRFPDGLNSIGGFAFSNCTNLSSIDLGENSQLTSIGKRAFKNCALSEIEIPKNVTSLGAYIFEDCENLATIHFNAYNCDDCISTSNVFGGTGSNSLEVVFGNTVENIPAYLFYSIQNLTLVDIGDNVSAIGENSFYHTGLTNIVLPGNIESVGDGSFSYCRSLTDVTIQDGVKTIGTYAFDRCSLTSLFIPKSVTQIGQSAFIQCNFATITVDVGNPNYKSDRNCLIEKNSNKLLFGCSYSVIPDYVTSIGNSAFAGYSSLSNVVIPYSVKSIGNYAFLQCSGLTEIDIPNSVESIGLGTFEGCDELVQLSLPFIGSNNSGNEFTKLIYIFGNYAYSVPASLKIVIVKSGTEIPSQAFKDCEYIEKIILSDSITKYGSFAFFNCESLTDFTISNNVTDIDNSAFGNCESLTEIVIPENVTRIGSEAFWGCTALKYVFLERTALKGITDIEVAAFGNGQYGCPDLEMVCVPDKDSQEAYRAAVKSGFDAFKQIICYATPGLQFSLDTSTDRFIVSVGNAGIDGKVVIPNTYKGKTVGKIGNNAFKECTGLIAIELPTTVTWIDSYAFSGCVNLSDITLSDSVSKIGNYAFKDCTALTTLDIPNQFINVDDNVFEGSGITNIVRLRYIFTEGILEVSNTFRIRLVFDNDPVGLTVNNITINGSSTGKLSGSGTERVLELYNVTRQTLVSRQAHAAISTEALSPYFCLLSYK